MTSCRNNQQQQEYAGFHAGGNLASWRAPRKRRPRLPLKIAGFVVSIVLLATFGVLLFLPFSRPNFRVLVVAPPLMADNSIKLPLEIDLPSLLSSANGFHVSAAIAEQYAPMLVPNHQLSLATKASATLAHLEASVTPQTTLMVYLSGVLSLGSVPGLAENSRDAIHARKTLDIIGLVRGLQQLRCKQILLCVDATMPESHDSSVLISDVWKSLRMHVEKQLVSRDATPTAAILSLQSIDTTATQKAKSSLASRVAELFRSEHRREKITLGELQDYLANSNDSKQEDSRSSFSNWLVSANWPIEINSREIPFALDNSKQGQLADGLAANTAEDSNSQPSPLVESLASLRNLTTDELDRWLETANVSEMLRMANQVLQSWTHKPSVADCPLLRLPKPLSRQQLGARCICDPAKCEWQIDGSKYSCCTRLGSRGSTDFRSSHRSCRSLLSIADIRTSLAAWSTSNHTNATREAKP